MHRCRGSKRIQNRIIKNSRHTVVIDNYGMQGEGVTRIDDVPIFIEGAIVGEKILCHIVQVKPTFARAKVVEVLSASPIRREPICPSYSRCGGCNLQHMSYDGQLAYKLADLKNAFTKAKIDAVIDEAVPSPQEHRYRNKASLPVREVNGEMQIGFFSRGSHKVVPIEDCFIHPEWTARLLVAVKEIAKNNNILPYNELTNKGQLRHIVARELDGHICVTLVTTSRLVNRGLYENFTRAMERPLQLWQCVNKQTNNVILSDEFYLIGGENPPCRIEGIEADIHPAAFFQVNDGIREAIYKDIVLWCKHVKPKTLVDCYSGVGLLAAQLSKNVDNIYSLELSSEATESAKKLMKANGISNVTVVGGDCSATLPQVVGGTKESAIILDPPRTGCSSKVLETIEASGIGDILYLSCNAATLTRDLSLLPSYDITKVVPYDMFPQTSNLEVLVTLRSKKQLQTN